MSKNYTENGMVQYHRDNMPEVEDVTIYEHEIIEEVYGGGVIAIIIGRDPEHPCEFCFGDKITHAFETLDDLEEWNDEHNHIMFSLKVAVAISRLRKKRKG